MSREDEFGNQPAWVATLTLPLAMLLVRTAVMEQPLFRVQALVSYTAVDRPTILAELVGLVGAALIAVVAGPHLTALLATGTFALAWAMLSFFPVEPIQVFVLPALGMAASVGVLGSMGASSGGGAPGLRYALFFSGWVSWLLAPYVVVALEATLELSTLVAPSLVASGLAFLALVVLFVPTLSWWFGKRHPRPAAADATYRVSGIAGVAFAGLLAVYAVDRMRWVHLLGADPDLGMLGTLSSVLHIGSAVVTAALLGVVSVLLQLLKRPARMGILAGAGCLLLTLSGVWAWTSKGEYLIWISLLAGIGQALLLPWIWARSTSDAHWRATTALGAVALFAPHGVQAMSATWSITAMIVMVFAAIPVGALGMLGDDWVFGDVPGSTLLRRGRR